MESLLAESARVQVARFAGELPPPASPGSPLAERTRAIVRRWSSLHEHVAPVRRVALLYEPFSEVVAGRLAWIRRVVRTEVESTFDPEFALRDSGTRPRVVASLCTCFSWETWNELRARQGLDAQEAEATLVDMVGALLAGMPGGK